MLSLMPLTGGPRSGKRPDLRNRLNAGSMTLVKAELGIKRVCPSCAARFYDLQKRPIDCPKCHFTFEPETMFKQRRPRQPEAEAVIAPVAAEESEDENEETEEEGEE